jgi:hypothetical protein
MARGLEQAGRRPRFDWRFTVTKRKLFIAKLAETYDVEAALGHAGLSWPQVCELRTRHPDFAARFEEVIAAGYDRLETLLLREAGLGGPRIKNEALAQALLKQRRAMKPEGAGRVSSQRRAATLKAMLEKLGPPDAPPAAGRHFNGSGSSGPQPVAAAAGKAERQRARRD